MKKIGIVTFYNFYNYGSVLQAFALSKKIDLLGYESVLIDYANMNYSWNKKLKMHVWLDRALCLIQHPSLIKKTLFAKKNGSIAFLNRSDETKNKFDEFILKNFRLPKEDYTGKNNEYWAFVCGSDQIWQLDAPGLHYTFFLRFCERKKRIAYAASFGTYSVRRYNEKRLSKYLKEFSSVSVREDVGLEIVNKYAPELKAEQVLDPVLLMDSEWWKQYVPQYKKVDKYILCYFMGDADMYMSQINRIADYHSARIVWIDSGLSKVVKGEVINPNPFEFLGMIKNAEYVCTDSLHGTEFSIIFEKNFTVFNRNYIIGKEQQSRIDSLLKLLLIEDRRYTPDGEQEYKYTINYDFINKKLEYYRGTSEAYLQRALKRT